MSPTGTITAPPTTTTAPQYFQDADGNIYNASGDLVYDTTTSSLTPTAQTSVASSPLMATSQTAPAPMSGLAVTTPEVTSSYYSYGADVDPAKILSSKNGGTIRKFADGGMSDLAVTSLSDFVEDPVFDYSDRKFSPMGGVKYDATTGLATDVNGNTMDVGDFVGTYGTHPSNFTPDFYPKDNSALETFYSSMSSIDPSKYDDYFVPDATYSLGGYGAITGQQIQDYFNAQNKNVPLPYERNNVSTTGIEPPVNYYGGMPQQTQNLMPTQGPAMPTQGGLMPQQGSAMPQQTPFSTSPTFRFSGANNPLLTGLRQGPVQQPYMLMPNGTFAPREEISTSRTYAQGGSPHGNPNIPMSDSHNPNVPVVEGRQDYREGAYVQGAGDGQSDDIPAMLADGEYVIDAETVAQLGNGSNKAGAKMLDEFRENIRAHKRSAPTHKIPPKSKSPLAYLKGAK